MTDYKKESEKIVTQFNEKISKLADKLRTELIIPACKVYGYEFISGNGTYFFSSVKNKDCGDISNSDDAKESGIEKFITIFQALDLEVTYDNYLGYHVNDVRKEKP